VSACTQFNGSATLIAFEIRKMIFNELHLTASAGIATNKFLAKIASDWNKPNGQFVIRPQDVDEFIKPLPIEKIYGVGKVTAQKMHRLGLRTCQDIQERSLENLLQQFGSRGHELYHFARGRDEREVETHNERKSISVETTFNKDIETLDECLKEIPELYADWLVRLEKSGTKERLKNISVKLKFSDFKTTTHEAALSRFPQIEDFHKLLEMAWQRRAMPVRLIGVGAHLFSETTQRLTEPQSKAQLKFAI
jgi:DNA polymerase IV